MKITTLKTLATALVCTLAAATAEAQTAPKMEMTTDIPPGIVSPDKVETRLGTLNFIDGFPDVLPWRSSSTTWTSSARYRPTCLRCRR